MDTSKIIRGVVSNGRYTVTAPIIKEDYGLYLKIEGVELPPTYQVDFSNSENNGTSVTMIGNADGVLIPHQFISTGKDVFAFLYWVGADYGKTVYKFRIPNKLRPDRTNEEPTPEEQSVIDQTIAALNEAVESTQENADKAETAVEHYPQIVDGTWRVWDVENGQWLDTGIDAEAVDGVSPTVSVSNSNGIHTVIITDANGRKTATIYDGLSIIMLTSSFVIPTDENGVLTQDVRLVAKFRIMRGSTIIDGRVMPNSSITLTNPNAPQLRVVYWREGVSVTDPQTEVTLPSGYKLVGGDSGMFSIKLRVGNTDYVVNPTWALAKRGEQGEQGEPGESGYSPTANVNKSGKTTTITITDKNGTTSAQVEDGTDGTDGISPTVTITPITGGHRITITDKDGEHSADVMDGTGNVDDVQINGSSIVTDGVANVPYGASDRYGVFKIGNGLLDWQNNGTISVWRAYEYQIKQGIEHSRPIVPLFQDLATFYGLAKAAGHDEKNSALPVGTYTEDAKSAIHEMLGIGTARELRAYTELGEDMSEIEIPLPERYEKVWFRFQCRINNAENNLPDGTTSLIAFLADTSVDSYVLVPSVFENVYIRQSNTYMIKAWFVIDFPFVERFATDPYDATNWSAKSKINSFDGSYSADRLTSYPMSLYIRPYDKNKGHLFKANSKLGVYVK